MFANYIAWIAETDTPMLMFYYAPGFLITEEGVQWAQTNISNLTSTSFGEGGHFLPEMYPEEIGGGIAEWLAGLPE